jgi:hypothetical protein
MSQHTPGPWIKHSRFVFRAGDGHLTICELQGSGGKYVERRELELDDPRFDEIHANGRLIAAAPDMLDALRQAEQFIANGIEMGAIRMPAPDSDDSAVNTLPAIRAAIAKVEGTP